MRQTGRLLDTATSRSASAGRLVVMTDSFAHFDRTQAQIDTDSALVVVANHIVIGGRTYVEGVDLHPEDMPRLLTPTNRTTMRVIAPSVADYVTAIQSQAGALGIIIITGSKVMFESWQHARLAAQQMVGLCPIAIIDSGSLSASQGLLVQRAIRAIAAGTGMDEIVHGLRGAAERSYMVCYTETMESLFAGGVVDPAHAILGTMLGVKPVLTVEDGQLRAMEKVRTRAQAIERLVEFAVEFIDVDEAVILHSRPGASGGGTTALPESVRMLVDRLAVDFPDRVFPTIVYGPSLSALIGTDATGLVILERAENEAENGI